jgi:mycothiol synthase
MPTDPITLPYMPDIEGLCFRPIRSEEDTEALYAVHAGRIAHDKVDLLSKIEDLPSRDGLRGALSQVVAAGKQDQWLVAQVNERVVGYSNQTESWFEEDGVWVYFIGGWVLPEWRGQGIGTAMLHWGEHMARRSAASQYPNERFEFAANASCTEQDATALLLHEGYYVGFTTLEMRQDISIPLRAARPLPDGIEVRLVLPEHYPLIVSSIIESYQHEFPGNRFRGRVDRVAYFSARLSDPKRDPNLLYVAWDGNEIAGQITVMIENGRAEVDQVSIRPAWRRKGLGRALLTRVLQDVRERGVEVIWLDTIAEYPTRAVDLYSSLGFHVIKEFQRYRKSS